MEPWQAQLADSFTDPTDLLQFLEISAPESVCEDAERRFPFRVTRSYAGRMRKGDIADPLLRQVLPLREEVVAAPGFSADPVGDRGAAVMPGILHKYQGRALLLSTAMCAIGCRYCFRRDFPYGELQLSKTAEAEALAYIAVDRSIEEIILSGGDPLLLGDRRIAGIVSKLADIPHVQRVRVHSRVPVVLPSRITRSLIDGLIDRRVQLVMVIHANHPDELDQEVVEALARLRRAGFTMLNQAVLLRGVNDDPEILVDLSDRLFRAGVLPYYLHLLDRARGTAHFEVSVDDALILHERIRRRLPGYLVPRLAREEAGQPYKTLL